MEIQHIPKTFWHALSVAVLVVSSGLTYIAYKSSSVSIELANAKINLSSEVASSTIALKNALDKAKKAKEEAEQKYAVLVRKHDLVNEQLRKLQAEARVNKNVSDVLKDFKLDCPECIELKPLPKSLELNNFDVNIEEVQKSLDRLEEINQQIQPIK
ncbi:hypothetical protein [Vibrio hangzhouensis]|uniref:Bacteriophage Rz lysis protein n=1 Tax=Vibrio hangzhouensis TaxID=462991 RepID=A0A1H5W1U9_9VIBR|nr:hypothetical protein [Vibrio hangzhouensis]SEF93465.1 hypothetical protein SAMN04488244_105103 [Vibrio hangzhouensis]